MKSSRFRIMQTLDNNSSLANSSDPHANFNNATRTRLQDKLAEMNQLKNATQSTPLQSAAHSAPNLKTVNGPDHNIYQISGDSANEVQALVDTLLSMNFTVTDGNCTEPSMNFLFGQNITTMNNSLALQACSSTLLPSFMVTLLSNAIATLSAPQPKIQNNSGYETLAIALAASVVIGAVVFLMTIQRSSLKDSDENDQDEEYDFVANSRGYKPVRLG